MFLKCTQTDLPQAPEFWAQASGSLAPPVGRYCLCHLPSVPWSTGQILHTCSGTHCLSLVVQSQTIPLRLQTPGPVCTLQRITESKKVKEWAYIVPKSVSPHFILNNSVHDYVVLGERGWPRQANPAAEEASPAAVGKLLTEQMWTLWDKTGESRLGFPSLRLFLANRRTTSENTKCCELISTLTAVWRRTTDTTHSLSNRTAVSDEWCPPLCHWAIFGLPEMICWWQQLSLFSTGHKDNKTSF